ERVVRWNAVPQLQEPFEKLKFRAAELSHFGAMLRTTQHGQKCDQYDFNQIVPDILGSGIGNALERGQEELHRRPPRIGGSPLKNPQLAPLQAPSAQLICDSPAGTSGTASATSNVAGNMISNFLRSLFHVTLKARRPVRSLPMTFRMFLRFS